MTRDVHRSCELMMTSKDNKKIIIINLNLQSNIMQKIYSV